MLNKKINTQLYSDYKKTMLNINRSLSGKTYATMQKIVHENRNSCNNIKVVFRTRNFT